MKQVVGWMFLAAVAIIGCSHADQETRYSDFVKDHAVSPVDSFIVDELTRNRVVMLGDMAHGQWVPRQTVIDALECWFREVTADSTGQDETPRRMGLVLECDSLMLGQIERYMESGDPHDVIVPSMFYSPQFTTSSMEFYWRLGCLRDRVDEFNRAAPEDRRIAFAIFPAEHEIDIDNWSIAKRDDYFLHVRDSLSALRVASFLKDAPEYHFLMFYGQAHLQRGLVMKHTDDKAEAGLYLATYLDTMLPGSFVTIGQAMPDNWGSHAYDFVTNYETYALPLSEAGMEIAKAVAGWNKYDAVVIHSHFRLYGTSIPQIPSLYTARLCVSSLRSTVDTENDFHRAAWAFMLYYLEVVSGRTPHRVDLTSPDSLTAEAAYWESWIASAPKDIVPQVADLTIFDGILNHLAESPQIQLARQCERRFTSFFPYAPLFPTDTQNIPTPSERAEQLRRYLEANRDDLALTELVGLLWVGSKDEAREAEQILQERTGEYLIGRTAWAEWLRARGQ